MGLRLFNDANPITCEFINEHLYYEVGSSRYKISVPNTAGLVMPKQCNMFQARYTNVLLENEKYMFLLRKTGSGTVYTKTGCLVRNVEYDARNFPLFGYYPNPGIVFVHETGRYHILTLFYDNGFNYILSIKDYPFSLTFTKEENKLYTAQLGVANSLVSKIKLNCVGNKLMQMSEEGEEIYSFTGNVQSADLFRYIS